MATVTATETSGPIEVEPKRPYVLVFAILAVVTLVELSVYSLGLPRLETIAILVILATIKASLVVAYYMHLKYDHRLFRVLFTGPLLIASLTLLALMFLFGHLYIKIM